VERTTFFLQGDCERTEFPDSCIDVVVCAGMLHHIDLSNAFPELRRIMKPGAVAIANEGLNYNPLIKWYRNRTPNLRTKFEKDHILTNEDLRFAGRFFEVRDVKYWHFLHLGRSVRKRDSFAVLSVLSRFDGVILKFPM
jgi:ubiquinone/menaquinone biosynthesis C-methylase UbiE